MLTYIRTPPCSVYPQLRQLVPQMQLKATHGQLMMISKRNHQFSQTCGGRASVALTRGLGKKSEMLNRNFKRK